MARPKQGGLVYSTEEGRICPGCRAPARSCQCRKRSGQAPGGGPIRVGRQIKGRKGKGVTVVTGLPLNADALADLGSALKKKCGSGGTVREGVIEIQGDHRDAIVAELIRRGWSAKRSGS